MLPQEIALKTTEGIDLEGGDAPEEGAASDPMAKIADFLSTMPPNWDLAEAHGKANLCINSSETVLNFENPDSYCQCCHLPIPTEEQMYPICVANKELGDLGPGFPLFFIFMKYLAVYLFILTLIFFLPMAFLIWNALQELKGNLAPDDSMFALFSLGAIFQHIGEPGYDLDVDKRARFLNAYGGIFLGTTIFSALFISYIKTKLDQKIAELDQSAFTPSDYCVMGQHMFFDEFSPEYIKK
jgi:drug/metabolite transporter superfamily protein YnfA